MITDKKSPISVEEYLHTSFDGSDREYLDGEIVERNFGNLSHAKAQGEFLFGLEFHAERTGIFVILELRHRVSRSRVRISDVAVFEREPAEEVPSTPPLVAIEVLSPDDRIGYIIPKLEEYWAWGVKHIWLADPEDRKLFTYGETGLHEVLQLALPEHGITLTLEDIFGEAVRANEN